MENNETQITPAEQALVNKVQEIGKTNHDRLVEENRRMLEGALEQVRSGMVANFAAAFGTSDSAENKAAMEKMLAPARAAAAVQPGLFTRLGLSKGFRPAETRLSKAQALAGLAAIAGPTLEEARTTGGPEAEVLAQALLGMAAFSIESAHKSGIIAPAKKGVSKWKIAALAVGGAVLAGGAVAGGMYVAEAGPFKPKGK